MSGKMYRFWVHNLPGAGDKTIQKLLARFGEEEEIYRAAPGELKEVLGEKRALAVTEFRKVFPLEKAYEQMVARNISFYTARDGEYPSRLKSLSPPPYGIYCLGKLPEKESPAAAVIGARECSEYGSYMAKAFAAGLAKAGVSIISGMARGIDGTGQQAALAGGGKTYAVLGCGVDICYPASNRKLYEEILEKEGGVLSVFPPGTKPLKGRFPERNRIVAGLSDLVLVVEARQKSGTWITVDMALEQGKNVYAVPGRLTDRLSDGCNLLIRQGAGIALSPEDMIAELVLLRNRSMGRDETPERCPQGEGVFGKEKKAGPKREAARRKKAGREAPEREKRPEDMGALRFLDYHPRTVDEILERMRAAGVRTGLSEVISELVTLCMEGKAKQLEGSCFVRKETV